MRRKKNDNAIDIELYFSYKLTISRSEVTNLSPIVINYFRPVSEQNIIARKAVAMNFLCQFKRC